MMPLLVWWVRLTGLLLALYSLSACGLSGGSISGKVIDEATGKPIAGAIVVARWIGDVSSWADSQTVCYYVQTAATDKKGRYKISGWRLKVDEKKAWHKNLRPDDVRLAAYKAGYEWSSKFDKPDVYLKLFTGTKEQRETFLRRVISGTNCVSAGSSKSNLYLLREAIFYEAKKLGVSHDRLKWFRKVAASAAVKTSNDVTGSAHKKAIEKFLEDHLQ